MNTTEFNTILFGTLSAINNNLSNIIAFKTENENKFITAGISFFGEQLDLSKQIAEYQKGDTRSKEEKKDDDRAKNTKYKESIFLSEGGLDIGAYFKNIKENIRGLDELSDFFDMGDMFFDDEEDTERLISQPLKFIPQMIIKSFIPKMAQDSIKLIDQSFKSVTGAIMTKLNAMGSNEDDDSLFGRAKSIIGRIFGYSQENKSSADLSKYERGPVPFDGITRKTIVDVIPTYLRRIESAITSTNERVYDYDTGTFKDINDMIK